MVVYPPVYSPRIVDAELQELLTSLPAVVIDGPKGVGKTLTARQLAKTEYALDHGPTLEVIGADPQRMTQGAAPILIDEWQRFPSSWDIVRRSVDEGAAPGRFLLTGSANPTAATHSGAGRIVRVRMRPLSMAERALEVPTISLSSLLKGKRPPLRGRTQVSLADYANEICASGFPGLRGLSGRALRAQLDGYLDRIIDRDFPELGHVVRNPVALRRWLAAYAATSSTTASFEKIRDAASSNENEKTARTTTMQYRDVLERIWVLDPVPAWLPSHNHLKRLGAASKHQLVDPALAARLIGVDADALLEGREAAFPRPRDVSLLSQLFESLVAASVRVYSQASESSIGHLRTNNGNHEVDLIVSRNDRRVIAIEVKLSQSIDDDDVRHLLWLQDTLGDDLLDAIVVHTGSEAYRRKDGIGVVPAALLGP